MMAGSAFNRLAWAATVLALCVVVLGAYVRLSNAGLGCPDWPGCYGQIGVPTVAADVSQANAAFPERQVEAHKAWKEMIHRYFAGMLGLLILALAIMAWRNRDAPGQPVKLPLFLVGLVIFQALLGMWTVTLLLKPVVVMGHLLGGLTTLALLAWLSLRTSALRTVGNGPGGLRVLAAIALAVLISQIALGGWTSANYAALACYDFPTCQGQWWPAMDFREAFVLWRGLGVDYEGGVLGNEARVAIHVTHRLGALAALLVIGLLALRLLAQQGVGQLQNAGKLILVLLGAQLGLGLANVFFSLPLPVAAAHNGFAALLLLSVVYANYVLRPAQA